MTTTWHVNLGEEDPYNDFVIEGSAVPEGHLLVCKASKRVWEELYAHKKPVSICSSLHSYTNICKALNVYRTQYDNK